MYDTVRQCGKRQHYSDSRLLSLPYFLSQVGCFSLQPAPSLAAVAAVAPGHRPLDTTTVSLNNVPPRIPSPTPPSFSPPLLSNPSLPPIMKMKPYSSAFTSNHLPAENCCCCQLLWHEHAVFDNQTGMTVFVWLHPNSVLCLSGSIVRPAVFRPSAAGRWAAQEKKQNEVNQSTLPIHTLEGQESVFSCVHWLGCEHTAE